MILSDIRDYLTQRGQVTLADIALHFDTEPEAMRGMLDRWVSKGKVERRKVEAACGTRCTRCNAAATELYIWRG
jgi:predicted ArsR family transcriptional regulator